MDQVYRLHLQAPLHVGSIGIGKEGSLAYMPSDTLFAAMVATWAWLAPERLDAMLAQFAADHPPFLLTSAFPYAGDVRLFPTPAVDAPLTQNTRVSMGKKLKRLSHVSEQILLHWLAGDDLSGELEEIVKQGGQPRKVTNLIQGDHVWVTSQERRMIAAALGLPADEPEALKLWGEEAVPHVVVGRVDNRPNLYHTGRVYFAKACGLWFGVRDADPIWQADIARALDAMADSGMGGLRSTGHGAFEWQLWPTDVVLPAPRPGSYGLLLSRLAPKKDQMPALMAEKASYRLATVGGWCGNDGEPPRKRRRVRLVAEGSIVGWPGEPLGQLVDVNPVGAEGLDHPVFRYGYGLAVGVEDKALEDPHE